MSRGTRREPTRIGLVSDTHGWLDPALAVHFRDARLIVHAGDVDHHRVLDELRRIATVVAVRGNADGGELRCLKPTEFIEIEGWRIVAVHDAGSPLRVQDRKREQARALVATHRAHVLVFGHTHVPMAARLDGAVWVNPGAAGHQGSHLQRTAALLEIGADGQLQVYRIGLGPR